ncbi:hypothetical protein SprV_0602047400 [Sparganum proliferum]
MLMDAYRDKLPGTRIANRTDGQLLKHRRMHFQSCVSTNTDHELLFVDNCALNATTEGDMEKSADIFSTTCKKFGLIINTEKTVARQQPPPKTANTAPQITVNKTQMQVVDSFRYLSTALSHCTKIDVEFALCISKCQQSLRSSSEHSSDSSRSRTQHETEDAYSTDAAA